MNLRRGLKRRGVGAAIDITPLVDVVFNLLIFLLVSTTFKSQEQAFSIVLPVGDQKTE
ncbi:MAG: biopolymer transporter ExbD, partial [Deltaproteobacteria bacterium]|nr:biopolymer transporter ExbD [Deltaproteobacteria bacterium]